MKTVQAVALAICFAAIPATAIASDVDGPECGQPLAEWPTGTRSLPIKRTLERWCWSTKLPEECREGLRNPQIRKSLQTEYDAAPFSAKHEYPEIFNARFFGTDEEREALHQKWESQGKTIQRDQDTKRRKRNPKYFKKRAVVIEFNEGGECQTCDLASRHGGSRRAQSILIVPDEATAAKHAGAGRVIIVDKDGKLRKNYQVSGGSHLLMVDPSGMVRAKDFKEHEVDRVLEAVLARYELEQTNKSIKPSKKNDIVDNLRTKGKGCDDGIAAHSRRVSDALDAEENQAPSGCDEAAWMTGLSEGLNGLAYQFNPYPSLFNKKEYSPACKAYSETPASEPTAARDKRERNLACCKKAFFQGQESLFQYVTTDGRCTQCFDDLSRGALDAFGTCHAGENGSYCGTPDSQPGNLGCYSLGFLVQLAKCQKDKQNLALHDRLSETFPKLISRENKNLVDETIHRMGVVPASAFPAELGDPAPKKKR